MFAPNAVEEIMGEDADKLDEDNLESLLGDRRTPEQAQVTDLQTNVAHQRVVKIAVALAVVLVFVIVVVSLHVNAQTKASSIASCDYEYCLPYKAMLERHSEETISTCSNIYRIACDRWARRGIHSSYRDGMDRFIKRATTQLASAKVSSKGDQTSSDKAAKFFQSCQDTILLGVSQLAELVGYLKTTGVSWPKIPERPDVLATMARLRLTFDLDTLVAIARNEGAGTHKVTVGPSGWLGGHDKTMRGMTELIKTTYSPLALGVIPHSCPDYSCHPLSLDDFCTLAKTVYGFLGRNNFPVGSYLSDLKTLSRLTMAFDKHRWEHVFGDVFNLSNDSIVVETTSYEYMDAFSGLVRQVGEQNVHYFVGWLALLELAPFADTGIAIANYISKRFLLTTITPFACLQRTERFFGLATYSGLMRQMSPATLQLAENISSDIHKHLLHRLKQRPQWNVSEGLPVDINGEMNDLKRSSALLDEHFKIAPSMGDSFIENWVRLVKAGFSQHAMQGSRFHVDFTTQRIHNGLQPLETDRQISLLPPFAPDLRLLNEFGDPAENYGRFGVYAAITMLSDFLRNVSGSPAWSELFENTTSCFRANGVRRQEEDQITIRAQALKIAFEAFESTVSSTTTVWKARLGKQIFFLSFASLWCSHFHPDRAEADVNNMCLMTPGFLPVYDCMERAPQSCLFL